MAHKRKDTLTKSVEWWKHLRWNKRRQAKKERKAAVKEIKKELNENPLQ